MPMIVALLVLIVLILLFGAGAVKGWIKSTAVGVLGFAAICAVGIWLGSFFGEDGFAYVIFGGGGLLFVLSLIGKVILDSPPHRQSAPAAQRKSEREAHRRLPKIERLWFHFAKDVERFGPEARAGARRFYDAKDVQGLREFCREEIERLK
jgi:hypothetical protein